VQADGKILVGGSFTLLGSQLRNRIGRLNPDGSVDPDFDPDAENVVYALALQADGRILVGGGFITMGEQSRTNLARLNNTGPATESLTYNGSTVTWLRGGTGAEVSRTTFEEAANGVVWTNLGNGVRIAGGWQMSGVVFPTNAAIRARGQVAGGQYNGSGWFVERLLTTFSQTAPIILQDSSFGVMTNRFGFNVQAVTGQLVVVEGSSDMVKWTALSTNRVSNATSYFNDPAWTTLSNRSYRARLWP
jgi:hypothetical protein